MRVIELSPLYADSIISCKTAAKQLKNAAAAADSDSVVLMSIFFYSQGITFDEFRSFFQFLNNLEDFAIAMQMYNFANRSIGKGKNI